MGKDFQLSSKLIDHLLHKTFYLNLELLLSMIEKGKVAYEKKIKELVIISFISDVQTNFISQGYLLNNSK